MDEDERARERRAVIAWLQQHHPDAAVPDEKRVAGRRRRLRLLVAVCAVAVVGAVLVAGWAAGTGASGQAPRPDTATGWRAVVGTVLTAAGFLLGVLALVGGIRSGGLRSSVSSPVWALTWAQRREAWRQVRELRPLDRRDVPMLRMVAGRLARQTWVVGLYAALTVAMVGNMVVGPSRQEAGTLLVVLVAGAVGVTLILRTIRVGRAFLRRYPGDETTPGSPGPV